MWTQSPGNLVHLHFCSESDSAFQRILWVPQWDGMPVCTCSSGPRPCPVPPCLVIFLACGKVTFGTLDIAVLEDYVHGKARYKMTALFCQEGKCPQANTAPLLIIHKRLIQSKEQVVTAGLSQSWTNRWSRACCCWNTVRFRGQWGSRSWVSR